MDRTLKLILIAGAVALVAGIAVYIFFFNTDTAEPVIVPTIEQPFTPSPDTNSSPIGASSVRKDFLINGETVEDTLNPGQYYLAGAVGYCLGNGTCPSGADVEGFTITYSKEHDSFNIYLSAEPIGERRHEAEQFLIDRLGITTDEMCRLRYTVSTSMYVNERFAGQNLGFSFCSNSIQLP